MNASRIIGPLLAGAIIASAGSAWFLCAQRRAVGALRLVITGANTSRAGAERLAQRHAGGHSLCMPVAAMRAVLLRTVCLCARPRHHGLLPTGPSGWTARWRQCRHLHAAAGLHGRRRNIDAMLLPRIRQIFVGRAHSAGGVAAQSHSHARPYSPHIAVAVPGMMLSGMALQPQPTRWAWPRKITLPARLQARHVHLPDEHHGRHRRRRGAVGPGGLAHRCANQLGPWRP